MWYFTAYMCYILISLRYELILHAETQHFNTSFRRNANRISYVDTNMNHQMNTKVYFEVHLFDIYIYTLYSL